MEYYNFYTHERFSERLIVFTESYSMVHRFTIGCFIGDEKILVIDSGLGMTADLRRYIESVVGSAKPILCACTHGHLDHVGSACLFDEAYCSHLDFEDGNDPFDPIRRFCDLEDFAVESNLVANYCRKHMIMDNRVALRDIRDGDLFELGGIMVEAIAVPGHSKGSMAFYCASEKVCFTGDAVNTDTHLKRLDTEGFREYKEVMERFVSRVCADVTLWPAHLPLPMTIQVAKNLALASGEIAEGKIGQDPPAEGIFHTRKNNRNIRGHYVNNTCVVYNRALLDQADGKPDYQNCCYYSYEKWSDRVYTVTINPSTVNRITLMVFVGDEKILVIDSGHGLDGKLREYIEGFAGKGKPVIQACTHVGIDHAGGIGLFDEVYMHANDKAKLPLSRNKRLVDIQPFSNYNQEFLEYTVEHLLEAVDPERVQEIRDGDLFHLGNLDVECLFTPGHSTGHMSFYCASERVCFTGDAMNVDTHIKALDRQGMREYAKMLEHFMERIAPDTTLFSSHLNRPNKMRVPRNVMEACLEIADGQTAGDTPGEAIQQHTGGFHNPNIRMHAHGLILVIYDQHLVDPG